MQEILKPGKEVYARRLSVPGKIVGMVSLECLPESVSVHTKEERVGEKKRKETGSRTGSNGSDRLT